MKKFLLIFLLLIPTVLAVRTGVVVDIQGDIHTGCVDIKQGDSSYDVLKAFDEKDSQIQMKFDGELLGTPFLKSINNIEGKSEGTNKFSGWNFWVKGNNEFTEPPELAKGWGMGIGDYKITQDGDIIALNFATTEYNADWTVKTPPAKPDFIQFGELCTNLEMKDIKFEVDGKRKSGTIKIKPGSNLKITVEIENLYTDDTKLQDVYVEADIDDIETKESSERDISAGNTKDFKVDFDLPIDLTDDDYTLTLTIYGNDENGIEYEREYDYDLEVDREKHDLVLETELDRADIVCDDSTSLNVKILNIGEHDEDAKIRVYSDTLNLDIEDRFELDALDSMQKSYKISADTNGQHTITTQISYSGKTNTKSSLLTVTGCNEQLSLEQSLTTNQKPELQDEPIPKSYTKQPPKIIKLESTSNYLGLILPVILVAAILASLVIIVILKK